MPPEGGTLVVGAGVSGLACAREVAAAGKAVQVLERARGVGGRCATRRLEGLAFDTGVSFLHGRDPAFLAAVREVPGRRIEGWPAAISGAGRPCQPEAFQAGEMRLALGDGVSAFPKHLARGISVRTGACVERLDLSGGRPRLHLEGGEELEALHVVLALAPEQVLRLLSGIPGLPRPLASVRALLETSSSEPSLSLCAAYPPGTPVPQWDACYPEDSTILQFVARESGKRDAPPFLGLVLQSRPAWARRHLDDPAWPEALLAEAGRHLGTWAANPSATHAHRWTFARTDLSSELSGPVLVRLPAGASVGICGDRFARGGGVEAAWISGRELGRRLAALEGA
jgi:predicted NAD/FAD-dependent oxidoreductase